MSLHHVLYTGSIPGAEYPVTFWNLLVEIEFAPHLTPEALDRLRNSVSEDMEAVIAQSIGPHVREGSSCVDIYDWLGLGEDGPIFPLLAGESLRLFTHLADIEELLERTAQTTALSEIAYDPRGRAYEIDFEVRLIRREELDNTRTAPMPDPALVIENDMRLTLSSLEKALTSIARRVRSIPIREPQPASPDSLGGGDGE